jgi:hypothetical protein
VNPARHVANPVRFDFLRLAEKRLNAAASAMDKAGKDPRLLSARRLTGEAYEQLFEVLREHPRPKALR